MDATSTGEMVAADVPQMLQPEGPALANDVALFQEAIQTETSLAPQAIPTQGPVTFQEAFATCESPFRRSQLADLTFRVSLQTLQ
jgi:hypothetical protein